MSSACQSAAVCSDAHAQRYPAYADLYKWAVSDAEFVRSLATSATGGGAPAINTRRLGSNLAPVVDSYSCRQKYLSSYTFTKKETVPEKTAKCFGKVKERAADLPCIHRRRKHTGINFGCFSLLSRGEKDCKTKKSLRTRKGRRSVLLCIFHRLLSCMSSFAVVDGYSVVHALQG